MWARMQAEAVGDLIGQRFEEVTETAALRSLQERQLGVSRLRLLPKHGGMRPIVNLGAASTVQFSGREKFGVRPGAGINKRLPVRRPVVLQFKPVNFVMQGAYHVSPVKQGASRFWQFMIVHAFVCMFSLVAFSYL